MFPVTGLRPVSDAECPSQLVDIVISEYCPGQETLSRYCGDWGLVLSLHIGLVVTRWFIQLVESKISNAKEPVSQAKHGSRENVPL